MQRLGAVLVLIWTLQGGNAWAERFSGFYVTAGGALQAHLTAQFKQDDSNADDLRRDWIDLGKEKFRGQLTAGYYYPLNEKFLMGFEVGTMLGSGSTAENNTVSLLAPGINDVRRTSWNTGHEWFVGIKPAMRLTPDTLGFLMLSHHKMKGRFDTSFAQDCADPVAGTGCTPISASSFSGGLSGTGIGIGMETNLSNKMFLQIAIERVHYGTASLAGQDVLQTFKATTISGLMAVGYRF